MRVSSLVFLSDGGDTVRDLQMYLSPESEHWLDWFHITMRLTVIGQYVKGLAAEVASANKKPVQPDGDEPDGRIDAADIAQRLERLKWNLWHGNVRRALQIVDLLEEDLEIDDAGTERRFARNLLSLVSRHGAESGRDGRRRVVAPALSPTTPPKYTDV
jgi:hypothetical protein